MGILTLIFLIKGMAQSDPVFTQYMFNSQAINPAYAGMWEKVGFTSLIRKQWAGIDRSPLTEMISLHSPMKNEFVGMGLNISNDRYGLENRLSIFGDYAYEVSITPRTRLRLGLKFGFLNYKNPLTQYKLYPDHEFDQAFAEDVDLKFLPNFGVGAIFYNEDYYISIAIPKLVKNDFQTNINNYSTQAEIRTLYLYTGYIFHISSTNNLVFKPTLMIRASMEVPLQFDLSANFMLYDRLWLGAILRSGDAICFISQIILDNNFRLGFAMDITYNELFPYQFGTYEFTVGFDIDFYGRKYLRAKYF